MTARYRPSLAGLLVAAATLPAPAAAHVEYTADGDRPVAALELVVAVLSNPLHAGLLVGGAVGVLGAALGYLRYRPARRDVSVFRAAVSEYRDLLPWLLRLSFGLPLVGAGFGGYFVSPAVVPTGELFVPAARLFQIGLGFCLLFGLGTRVVAATGLVAYLVGLAVRPELLLAFEYVPGMLALVVVGSGRPSADQVLAAVAAADGTLYGRFDPVHRLVGPVDDRFEPVRPYVPTVVRVGLGISFVYLGLVEKLLAPGKGLAVVAKYDLTAVVPVDPGLWVVGAGLTEVALGLALIAGVFVRAGSLVALLLFTLTLFGLPDDPVLAHVTLFGLASTLIVTGAGPWSVDGRLSADRTGGTDDVLPDDAGLSPD